ncbi:MAG: bifunctional diaminohydroxyphosphoribosylaminopyrimidine deaminase/5-amino-6-(5-phosphoribosylamino)uracil reductase RibD [Bacteroidetes bacterium]|nr:bifunctional diaminohydroxyphosphoribosylaminopyrimidine deaminase/5-amino-6-(5-phosphoribosylamino)uracil reductase RibD [Bacteroidota bacterium]
MIWLFLWRKVMENTLISMLINHAIALAEAVDYQAVKPNPRVGALILNKTGKTVGMGAHQQWGGPHAEVLAIQEALQTGADLSNCTLYVTLEPCSHTGKTPPCTDLIIREGIPRVVYASKDPNPKVNGAEILNANGVEVIYSPTEKALELNKEFFVNQLFNRPYCILKMAQTANGYISEAEGVQTSISNSFSKAHLHQQLRSNCDAILSTAKTVITDNATLNIRTGNNHRELTAIVIDHDLALLGRPDLAIRYKRNNSRLMLVTDSRYSGPQRVEGIDIITIPFLNRKADLKVLLHQLYSEFSVHRLLVESGPLLANNLLLQDCVDEYHLYTASHLISPKNGIRGIESSLLQKATKNRQLDLQGDRYEVFTLRHLGKIFPNLV